MRLPVSFCLGAVLPFLLAACGDDGSRRFTRDAAGDDLASAGREADGPTEPWAPSAPAVDEPLEPVDLAAAKKAFAVVVGELGLGPCEEPVANEAFGAATMTCGSPWGATVDLHHTPKYGVARFSDPCRTQLWELAWDGEVLGAATRDERFLQGLGAKECRFQRGSVYATWTGTFTLSAALRDALERAGGADALGVPVEEPHDLSACGERIVKLERGGIAWHPAHGAHAMRSAMFERYASWRASRSERCDPPVTDEIVAEDNEGRHIKIGTSYRLYWHPQAGAHMVFMTDADEARGRTYKKRTFVGDTWFAEGGPSGPLGYPTSEAEPIVKFGREVGTKQAFQGGVFVHEEGKGVRIEWADVPCPNGVCGKPAKK